MKQHADAIMGNRGSYAHALSPVERDLGHTNYDCTTNYKKNYASKIYQSLGPRPKTEVDKCLQDLHNSSHHTKAGFNDSFIIDSKYF